MQSNLRLTAVVDRNGSGNMHLPALGEKKKQDHLRMNVARVVKQSPPVLFRSEII